MSFPGAVPRTFIGALALAGLSKPFLWLSHPTDGQFLGKQKQARLSGYLIALLRLQLKIAKIIQQPEPS
jgi:hypothetical protein